MRRLLFLLRRGRRRSQSSALGALPRHYGAEHIGLIADRGGRLRRASVLRRRIHRTRVAAAALKLTAQHGNLFLILLLQIQLGLLHLVDSLADHLHLGNLFSKLMLVALGLADVRLKLGADLIEELIETARAAVGRGGTPHTTMSGIHRHGVVVFLLSLYRSIRLGFYTSRQRCGDGNETWRCVVWCWIFFQTEPAAQSSASCDRRAQKSISDKLSGDSGDGRRDRGRMGGCTAAMCCFEDDVVADDGSGDS